MSTAVLRVVRVKHLPCVCRSRTTHRVAATTCRGATLWTRARNGLQMTVWGRMVCMVRLF